MKHTYYLEIQYLGQWATFVTGRSRDYCQGRIDAMKNELPRNHIRLMRSDGEVMDEALPHEDVGIGMIAGFPTPEQCEMVAERALAKAARIRKFQEENRG